MLAIVANGLNWKAMDAFFPHDPVLCRRPVAGLLVKFWLASRQIRHVATHRAILCQPPLPAP
jgi:hypothetical protein